MTRFRKKWISGFVVVSHLISVLPEPSSAHVFPSRASSFDRQALAAPVLNGLQSAGRRVKITCFNALKIIRELSFGEEALAPYRRPFKIPLLSLQGLLLLNSSLTMMVPLVGRSLYDTAARGTEAPGALAAMVTLSFLSVSAGALRFFRSWIDLKLLVLMEGFSKSLRDPVFGHWLGTIDVRYPQRGIGGRIDQALPGSARKAIEIPLRFIQNSFFLLGSGLLLGYMNPRIALAVGVSIVLLTFWTIRRTAPLEREAQKLNETRAATLAKIEEMFSPLQLKAMRTHGLEQEMLDTISGLLDPLRSQELRLAALRLRAESWQEVVSGLVLMTGPTLWCVWGLFLIRTPSLGYLLALLAWTWNVQYSFTTLLGLFRSRAEADAGTAQIMEGVKNRLHESASPEVLAGDLFCEGVSYQTPDGIWILKDVNIRLPAGKTLVIRGESGAGKTTLIRLLSGLMPPTKGKILIGGLPLEKARRAVAVVFQKSSLFVDLSVYENLRRARPNASEEEIRKTLWLAGADFLFSKRFPRGIHTLVEDISGGQERRVDLAAALLRHPKILFLDEPTAGLDPGSRRVLEERLRHLQAEGVTLVIVTHESLAIPGQRLSLRHLKASA